MQAFLFFYGGRKMKIREGIPEDADEAVYLMNLAIDEIGQALTGEQEEAAILEVMASFFKKKQNRLSHENTLVIEENSEIIGVIVVYHGSEAEKLDWPLIEQVRLKSGNSDLLIDIESEPEDYYIDTVCVKPSYRGNRLGTTLIAEAEKRGRNLGYGRMSLNVEADNKGARALYQKLGYQKVGSKTIYGHSYDYMVKVMS